MKIDFVKRDIEFLVDNHFKELSNLSISTNWHKEKDSFAYTVGNRYSGFKIYISKKDYKKLNKEQAFGVLSHELAHILFESTKGFLRIVYINLRMKLSSKYLTWVEREVDSLVIAKGCGIYLMRFMEYHDDKYKKYNKSDGLTKKEIRNLLKEVK